ncbi:VG15 protein [Microbacterium plantarum]|uniref:VG15 protein n=1 Tax=Microbacterium plantarum TaxID=1816425 RepID=UPI002B49C449|nr:hypothetical protein [Microbacterium plantarum]WRK16507.1 hypothetical protein VC184_11370 [Microbacterium plantarum]
MASTADGRELTRAHQAQQLRIATAVTAEVRALWARLDVDDLDGSTPYWLATTSTVVDRRTLESERVAGAYLSEYRFAEIGARGEPVLRAPTSAALALQLAGPVRVKQLISAGMDPEQAYRAARTKFEGVASRQALMGGRLTIAATSQRDRRSIGWRRVTDGNPCAFCAMLASRGPVYRDASTAEGLKYHAHCGCTAEPMYTEWEPTEAEQRYIDAYTNARYTARQKSVKDVVRDMRRNGGFRDSPTTRR